jgi:FtsP/CotA-like multicopper oxidase with cupredoxin domain
MGRLALAVYVSVGGAALAPSAAVGEDESARDECARPAPGASIPQPADLRSHDGELHLTLTIRSSGDGQGHLRYCYLDPEGHQAPTLRVRPGDTLYLRLLNQISPTTAPIPSSSGSNACAGGVMSAAATNLHFHGLSLPPVCHQDETLRTLVQPGDPPFE